MSEAPLESIDREKRAFDDMRARLLQDPRYAGKYVAVLGGEVVGSDAVLAELAKRVYASHGYRPIYMGLVTDKPEPRRVIE